MLTPDALPPQTKAHYYSKVMPTLIKAFAEDDDKDTVAAASEAISEIALALGPAAVIKEAPSIVAASIKLLKQKHPCFLEEDAGDANNADDGIDADGLAARCVGWEAHGARDPVLAKVREPQPARRRRRRHGRGKVQDASEAIPAAHERAEER